MLFATAAVIIGLRMLHPRVLRLCLRLACAGLGNGSTTVHIPILFVFQLLALTI